MSRTPLQGKTALVLGIRTAPGRASGQQLSRAGCRTLLASADAAAVERLGKQLVQKGGTPVEMPVQEDPSTWHEALRAARLSCGHIHLVVNAWALGWEDDDLAERRAAEALSWNDLIDRELRPNGPVKSVTLWPEELSPAPSPEGDHWHSVVLLGPRQRLDTESVDALDADGTLHLRAGAVADAVVCLLQFPPSLRANPVRLEAVRSAEKKEVKA